VSLPVRDRRRRHLVKHHQARSGQGWPRWRAEHRGGLFSRRRWTTRAGTRPKRNRPTPGIARKGWL